ncbi:MAG: tripartite tricarboxylate transporter substrate binding protein [Betaproteobacteria bacterium]|nr:tripartite tricarboxylate transporter substrate binding protein [Betaproteobacteria bacterium]
MLSPRFLLWSFLTSVMMMGAGMAAGQEYPSKLIRIVTGEAGGGSDLAARLIAQGLTVNLSQQVIVENRPGAGGVIAAQAVAKSPPDGYTLLSYSNVIWLAPLFGEVPYDPVRDFSAVSLAVSAPNFIVVHPTLPAKSIRELIALAKAKPGALNYASGSAGGAQHLAGELFKTMAGINMVRISYKGGVSAVNSLIVGEVQVGFASSASVAAHVKSGRLRALAVTSARTSALVPDLPTVAASGLPGYEMTAKNGIFAPTGTPAAMVNRLSQNIARIVNRADVRGKLLISGGEPVGSSPEEFAATIRSEIARVSKLIKDAGIHAE